MKPRYLVAVIIAALVSPVPGLAGEEEPDKVKVQHILIAFKSSIPGQKIDRTKKEAKALAAEVLRRAKEGDDFLALVEEYTDDRPPGIYLLTNKGAPRVAGGRMRDEMVPGFGDVAFGLEVGEIGVAEFNFRLSPYGWHIIKRLE
jgi:parvulin-like peptidyl-prolyl isomerase